MQGWLEDGAALAAAHVRSRAIGAAWRDGAAAGATRLLDAADAADPDAVVAAARTLLAEADWAGTLIAPLVAGLAGDPAFQPPFRSQHDALRSGALLIDHPAAAVTATVVSADALASAPPARSAIASGRLSVTRYHRAGGARLRRWQAAPATADYSATNETPLQRLPDLPLADGMIVTHDGRIGATLLEGAVTDVAMVTVSIRAGGAGLMREFALPSGAPIRAAALDEAVSRSMMLLALLRSMGRGDAGEAFLAATHAAAFHLRWQAMREWLATDVAAALPRLTHMAAADPHPEVRGAAQVTLAQLAPRRAA